MITPPAMTVERAWTRGLKVGRYKAVDDILVQNVEAYSGMPELFFMWALIASKRVHYEFLDNSVAEGCPPRTAAFGWNGEMTILDIKNMIDIARFRKITISAQTAADVYANVDLSPQNNLDFLRRCVRWIPAINFADYETGQSMRGSKGASGYGATGGASITRSKIRRQMLPCRRSLVSTTRAALKKSSISTWRNKKCTR